MFRILKAQREKKAHDGRGGKTYKSFWNWKGNMLCERSRYVYINLCFLFNLRMSYTFTLALYSWAINTWNRFEWFWIEVHKVQNHHLLKWLPHSYCHSIAFLIVSDNLVVLENCWVTYIVRKENVMYENKNKFCKSFLMEEYKMYWFFQQYFFVYVSFP